MLISPSRQGLHEQFCKVPCAEHEVRLERSEVVEERKLVKEDLEQALTRYRVRVVDRALQTSQVAVLQRCLSAVNSRCRSPGCLPLPAFASFACVSIQSLSLQLYRIKFKLLPVEKICREPCMPGPTSSPLTLRPNSSLTKPGTMPLTNTYFFSQTLCASSIPPCWSSPPSKPISPVTYGDALPSRNDMSGLSWTKNSWKGSCNSPEKIHLCSVTKNGFETWVQREPVSSAALLTSSRIRSIKVRTKGSPWRVR